MSEKPSNKTLAIQLHKIVLNHLNTVIPYYPCPLKRAKADHDKQETLMYLRGRLGGNEGITIDATELVVKVDYDELQKGK